MLPGPRNPATNKPDSRYQLGLSAIFEFSIPEVQEHLTSSGPWNPSSAGLFKLFWDALNEPDGWLGNRYPSLKSCVQ